MTFDIIIQGGMVIDGSGAPAYRADVGIQGERVTAIADLSGAQSARVIDARGKTVAPGFIDMHSHGDWMLPFLPTADSKIHQGITLEVVGNCGSSMAPFSAAMLAREGEKSAQRGGQSVDWQTFAGYFEHLRAQGTSVNYVQFAGHGTIREAVMGMTDAEPTPEQMEAMKTEVRQAMQAGASGLSTGLIYTPNVYAKTPEIIELAKVAAEMGGIYASHIRGEGNTLLEAIEEALEVGRQAHVAVQISHLKASGIKNWHKMPQALAAIEAARASGMDVTADMYPYNASNTDLDTLLPDWIYVGGTEAALGRIQDPAVRARLHIDLADNIDSNGVDWDAIYISDCPLYTQYEGRHLADIARERGQQPLDAVMDILIETRFKADIIEFTMREENVALGLQAPFVMIGTDASGRAAEGPFSVGKPHPRNYGSFPRVLGHFARQQELFSLEEAVRKMTSLPAAKLGLRERGLLQSGCFADVVVFDPQTVIDASTFAQPHQYAHGIEWVLVNGTVVIAEGQHSGALPGRLAERQAHA